MTNKTILDSFPFLTNLNSKHKTALLALINDPKTKITLDKERYDTLIISNSNHTLKIIVEDRSKLHNNTRLFLKRYYDSNRIRVDEFPTLEKAVLEHHTINSSNNPIVDKTGVLYDNYNIFSIFYKFYLDDELIVVRNYNADLLYYLSTNPTNVTPKNIYLFFSHDAKDFNKLTYEFFSLFNATNDFYCFDLYYHFHNDLGLYFRFNSKFWQFSKIRDEDSPIDLSYLYTIVCLVPKVHTLLAPTLTKLAKSGLNYKIKVHEGIDEIDFGVRYQKLSFAIYENNDTSLLNMPLIDIPLNYQFFSFFDTFVKGEDFWASIKNIQKVINEVVNQLNHYLQRNFLIAYNKILKKIDFTANNVALNDINDNKIYVAPRLQFAYGYLKNIKQEDIERLTTLDDEVVVFKYQNNELIFNTFKIDQLCVLLTKQELEQLELPYKLIQAKNYLKFIYWVHQSCIAFKFKVKLKTPISQPYEDDYLYSQINISDYTNYSKYCVYKEVDTENNLLTLSFQIPTKDHDFNTIFNAIYNEFKDKMVLEENVKNKIQEV